MTYASDVLVAFLFFWEHDKYFVLVSSGKPGTVATL